LCKVSANVARRKANAVTLGSLLERGRGKLTLPLFRHTDVPMVYPMVLRQGDRDALIVKLEAAGVEARPAFGCIPTQQPAYVRFAKEYIGQVPVSEWVGAQGFYVGCHQYLSESQLHRMADAILESVRG
jgi:dTDP-4-amino-4,6-dideoxygalactose transaminase